MTDIAPSNGDTDESATRERLMRFFAFHEPSQLKVVDDWLRNWSGQWPEMFRSLIIYHGREPPVSFSTTVDRTAIALGRRQLLLREARTLLQLHVTFYCPESLLRIDEVLAKWTGHEQRLVSVLEKFATRRDSVLKYFERRDPSQMAYAVQLAREWFGHEPALLAFLEANDGGLPPRVLQYPPLILPEYQRVQLARERLYKVLETYQPERLVDADAMLEAFRGREEEMFGLLASRYGMDEAGGAPDVESSGCLVTSHFGLCVQQLAEAWLSRPEDATRLQRAEQLLGQLMGTSIPNGEVLLRLAAETQEEGESLSHSDA